MGTGQRIAAELELCLCRQGHRSSAHGHTTP